MALSPAELRKRSLSLRYRAKSREPLDRLLPEAFALVRKAGRRTLDMRHFDVQLLGGMAMHHRSIAEMQTGEAKRCTATLPLYLEALPGHGAHLATVNDYLARRDAEWMRGPFTRRRPLGGRGRRPDAAERPPQGLRQRCHLRHLEGVRLRFPPRPPAAAGARARAKPTSWGACSAMSTAPASSRCNAATTSQ